MNTPHYLVSLGDSLLKLPIGMFALLLNKCSSVKRREEKKKKKKSELSSHSTARVLMPPAKLVPLDNARVVCTLALRDSLKMPTPPKIKNVKDSSAHSTSTTLV